MKTILAPTDYSDVSNNALEYAIELAKSLQAKLILFHAYHRRILLSSLPLLFADEELEKMNLDALKAREWIVNKKSDTKVECESIVYKGAVLDGIIETIEKEKIDYIVMGTTGSSRINEVLMGSTTISVIKKTNTPVFIIPKMAKYKMIEKIVYINDYEKPASKTVIDSLKELVDALNAKLTIFGKPESADIEAYQYEKARLEAVFASSVNINHSLSFSLTNDLTEEINSFVRFYTSDLLVMAHNNNSGLFNEIFNRDNTIKMIFHTHLPLLVLHDQNNNNNNNGWGKKLINYFNNNKVPNHSYAE